MENWWMNNWTAIVRWDWRTMDSSALWCQSGWSRPDAACALSRYSIAPANHMNSPEYDARSRISPALLWSSSWTYREHGRFSYCNSALVHVPFGVGRLGRIADNHMWCVRWWNFHRNVLTFQLEIHRNSPEAFRSKPWTYWDDIPKCVFEIERFWFFWPKRTPAQWPACASMFLRVRTVARCPGDRTVHAGNPYPSPWARSDASLCCGWQFPWQSM